MGAHTGQIGPYSLILGSEEYIITAEEIIQETIQRHGSPIMEGLEENLDNVEDRTNIAKDALYEFNHRHDGTNSLLVLNSIISQLGNLHDKLLKRSKQKSEKLQNTSKELFKLKSQLKRARELAEKEQISKEVDQLQKVLQNDVEAKELATQTRIKNLYGISRGMGQWLHNISTY